MRVAIYGAGSTGTVLGAFLTKNGIPVDLFNRNIDHVKGLREHGARIVGTVNMTVPVKAYVPDEMTGTYDIIFLMTKQADNDKVVWSLLPHLAGDGVICSLQNGMPEPGIAAIIGEDRTFGCSVAWGATLQGDGVSELTSSPDSLTFALGALSSRASSERLSRIRDMLSGVGKVVVEDNFLGSRWAKLLINSSFSGMSAVLGLTFGEVVKNKASRRCVQLIIKECIEVAKKACIQIEPIQGTDVGRLLDYRSGIKQRISFLLLPLVIRKHARLKASMLQDLEKGKKTEVDALNGLVCEYGEK